MVNQATLDRVIGAMRRLRDNPDTLRRYYDDREPPNIPLSLMAIHSEFTMPHEGGFQDHDSANGTLAGVTNVTFRNHMSRLGVNLSVAEAHDILEHLGSSLITRNGNTIIAPTASATQREAWELFQHLTGHIHYQSYNLRPGFTRLPEELQSATYDSAFHRGNGATMVMMARMLERNTDLDFPGIDTDNRGFDADPVVMERVWRRHIGNHNGRIVPRDLAAELRAEGVRLNNGAVSLVSSSSPFEPIDIRSTTPLDPRSVMLQTPYDDRLVNEPPGSPRRQEWDRMVDRVRSGAAQLLAEGWTEESFVAAIEAERRVHLSQVIKAQGSNRYAAGWDNRSREAEESIADIARSSRTSQYERMGAREAARPARESLADVTVVDYTAHVFGRNIRVQYRRGVDGVEAIAIDTPNGVFMYEIGEDGGFIQQLRGSGTPEGAELLLLFPENGHERNPSQENFTLTWVDRGFRHHLTLTPEVNRLIRDVGTDPTGIWGTDNPQAWFLMDQANNGHLRPDSDIMRLDDLDPQRQRISVTDDRTDIESSPQRISARDSARTR